MMYIKWLRNGVSQLCHEYGKAKNLYTTDQDLSKERKYLTFLVAVHAL